MEETIEISIEIYPNTFNKQEKFDNLLEELGEKYGVKDFVLGRCKDNKRKIELRFKPTK